MCSDAPTHAFLGSRPRVLARRSFSRRRAAKDPKNARIAAFRERVWRYWEGNGRHELPWRKTTDPYRVLVSEIMLQQTQVERVVPFYQKFLRKFPNVEKLANASLADVLKTWSGLGYNRRAKYLHDTARVIVEKRGGKIPTVYSELVALPGVGDYTAKAVRVFAFNEPDILIETNIRTVFLQHFSHIWVYETQISDRSVETIATKTAKRQDPRRWHWALMDYGAYLKRTGVRNNHKSAHYIRQSKFEGSLRQVRGAILRALHSGTKTGSSLRSDLKNPQRSDLGKFRVALASLVRDGLIREQNDSWQIA